MALKTSAEVVGFEHDWLAVDGEGNVGFFSTAGGGYAPIEFLADTEAHDAAIAAILSHPPSTIARYAPELGADHTNTWRLMAERGVYAFDSDSNGGPTRKSYPGTF